MCAENGTQMNFDPVDQARIDAKIAAKIAFRVRWNAAREAKLKAYGAADAAWHLALNAGHERTEIAETLRRALSEADAVEDIELDAARSEYRVAVAASVTSWTSPVNCGAGASSPMVLEHRESYASCATDRTRPRVRAQEDESMHTPPTPEPTPEPSSHILLVDDDRSTLKLMEAVLDSPDTSIDAVPDAESALTAFSARRADVVVTDLKLPGMDGIALLRAIRRLDLDVPVILITGVPELRTAIDAVQLGALSYLLKPVVPNELRREVARAVHLSRLANLKRQLLELSGRTEGQVGDLVGLVAAFGSALDQLWLAYQPIVRWSTRTVYAFEALVRSRESKLPHPGALIDAAERLQKLPELGRAIRSQVVAPPEGFVFVNLHPMDLLDEDLFAPEAPLSLLGARVVLEITERTALDRIPDVRGQIDRLRKLGFRVAIDDLGAGYAGLSAFAALTPEVAKLDMSLVRGVDHDPVRQRLIGSMIMLCRDLRIELVAEGVETVEERDTLVSLGCDLLQGFLFARPAAAFPLVQW